MPDTSGAHIFGEHVNGAEPEPESTSGEKVAPFPAFAVIIQEDGSVALIDPTQLGNFPVHQASTDQIAAGCEGILRRIDAGTTADAVIKAQQVMVEQAMRAQDASRRLADLGDLHRMPH